MASVLFRHSTKKSIVLPDAFMAALEAGLVNAVFDAGAERLQSLVDALCSKEFEYLEDLVGCRSFRTIASLSHIPLRDRIFQEQIDFAKQQKARQASTKRAVVRIDVSDIDEGKLVNVVRDFQQVALCVDGLGPRQAVKKLRTTHTTSQACASSIKEARLCALLGSCPRTHNSFLRGVCCWAAVAGGAL